MKKLTFALMIGYLVTATAPALAEVTTPGEAKVLEIRGEAKYLKAGTTEWIPLDPAMTLSEGDSVKTGQDSLVRLELSGSGKIGEVTVRKESEFTFKALAHDPATGTRNTLLDVHVGSVLVQAEKLQGESKFRVKTPTSIVGVRGTKFEVNVRKK
ncbi:MAG: hypothetical protein MOGMAGMI_01136 [Candidatus Omnitrophica bacterium]|nr:hypothetical protein [Candidatus Omnitrophota bacterium]